MTSNKLNYSIGCKNPIGVDQIFDNNDTSTSMEQCQSKNKSMELITATRKHDIYFIPSKNIAVKALRSNNPLTRDISNLDNEFKVSQEVSHPALRSSIKRTNFERKRALMLEWAPGLPLNQLNKVTVGEFLPIAREILSSILAMHMMQYMHADLSCEHIIFDKISKSVKIISCGSSTNFNKQNIYIANHELLNKDLRCVSPEQTGRNNRDIDYRSDFYSLGIIFYRLLAGKYPFESSNTLELLQLHICHDPLPLHTIDPKIPVILSDMVSRLMEKDADDRYQSAKGIMHDLDLIISEHETDKKLLSIELMQHDIPETLIIPQKLYSQSSYFNTLMTAFDKITTSFETVFVSGESGTGKSALVSELYRPVTKKGGIIISGKYDFSKAEPYSALLEAVNNFCDDLLLRDEYTINRFKSQIRNAIGDEGKILTDVIINLHLLIGKQPYIPDVFGQDAKNRFIYVFVKFIKAICSVGFPIVFVLEDLQWIDTESVDVISAMVKDKCITNLMLVGIYRHNEVSNVHPVSSLLQNFEKGKNNLTQIKIDNLVHESVNELISDTLRRPQHESYALTAMVHEKTKGNPFFVNRMLKSFIEQELIFFCNESRRWTWDASIFGARNIYEDVKELLRLKISSFDEHTQQVFKVASCLGSSFSLRTIKLIVNRSDGIECALTTKMIAQHKGSDIIYHFVHDHIQEAAFSLLPEDPRAIFLYIGKKLWKLFSKQELEDNIHVVVHLLKKVIGIVQDLEERSQIAELFLEAGEKSMASAAFSQAFEYLDFGTNMLNKDCWTTHYSLTLKLYDASAKNAYCISNYDKMNTLLDQVFKNVTCTFDVIKSYSLQIKRFNDKRMFEDAIKRGIYILNMMGEQIIDNRCQSITDFEFHRLRDLIIGTPNENILRLKEMEDDRVISVMMIFNELVVPCTLSNLQLLASISSRMVQLTLNHGISKMYAPKAFIAFGTALCIQGDKCGYQIGQLALTILTKTKLKENIPFMYTSFYGMMVSNEIPLHLPRFY